MLGLAQQLFIENGGSLPAARSQWPQLENLLDKGYISYVDYALAEMLLRDSTKSEEVAALICHLSIAAREGHLCIRINDRNLSPDPKYCWQNTQDGTSPLSESDWAAITTLIIQGARNIPKELLTVMTEGITPVTPICLRGDDFYLQRYWIDETNVICHLRKIVNATPAITLDEKTLLQHLEALQLKKQLLPEQAQAILQASKSSLTIIYGGPGTGKTYTAGQLIRLYWESMPFEKRPHCEIVLAAPTGKAAANLQKNLTQAVRDLTGFPQLKAKTLHSLLGIRSTKRRREDNPEGLSADLILVDESSMIDVRLMASLLASIKPGARLVLLGDPNQLPPISVGLLFADFIKCFSQSVQLKTCLRTELRGIVEFANAIQSGDTHAAIRLLSVGAGVYRCHLPEAKNNVSATQQALIDYILPHFPQLSPETTSPEGLLSAFSQFCLLSPLRQGPFGVEALNQLFMRHLLRKQRDEKWFVSPIIVVNNDQRLELANGEMGVLVRQYPRDHDDLQEGDYALFVNRSSDQAITSVRKISALLLPKYEHAFCLSVHKSQGSEWDHVLLLMPEGSEVFGREGLYTAVTRVRKKLEIWGSDRMLSQTIARHSQRLSGILQRWG